MRDSSIDILMITYNRSEYTRLSLERLVATCNDSMRIWLWHNGDHEETLNLVREYAKHPRVYKFFHSRENKKLWEPTNWLWENSTGGYVSKVDDDCLMPEGWGEALLKAHKDVPEFGILGCWRYPREDFIPEIAEKKIQSFPGGHRILRNFWIEGSGYLMKRECLRRHGSLRPGETFSAYGIRLSLNGWVHGWPMPFYYQEHMDDPRSEYSMLKSTEDLQRWMPLSARNNGVETIEEWQKQLMTSARRAQEASLDPRQYADWRIKLRNVHRRAVALLTGKRRLY